MSSSNLAWLDLAQDPHDKFSLEFFLKADVEFKPQANSLLPVLKLHSRTMMSELFTRGGFDVDLKQLEEVFRDDIAAVCAERHFSWEPVSVTPKSDSGTEADSISTDSSLSLSEAESTTDRDSDSETELWEQFDFPQLTAEGDMQLTMALQGSTPQPTTSMETSTTMNHPRMRSGVQDPTVQEPSETSASALRPLRPSLSPGPPPYMAESEFGATNNSQSMNGRHAYIVLDGVCHVLRVRDSGA